MATGKEFWKFGRCEMRTNVAGIEIDNPIVIASGPWTRGRHRLEKALSLGAGAIVTESIVSESYPDLIPRYDYDIQSRGIENIRLYSGADLETWIADLEYVNENSRFGSNTKLIASVMGSSPSELAYLAKKIEKTGVDGIELGIACPMGEGAEIIAGVPAKVSEYVEAVVSAVDLPVSVKLSAATGNLPLIVKRCVRAGASGISGIDTLRSILSIDIESGRPGLSTYGGYSGAPIRPIGLSAVAGMAQTTSLPIMGIGGVGCAENVIEYIMAGAASVGIGSQILIDGYEVVSEVIKETEEWFISHNVESVDDIRGSALRYLRSFDEIKMVDRHSRVEGKCADAVCLKCIRGCLDGAISFDNVIKIDESKCSGCGLCISKCPEQKLKLMW